jgi:hypothetical protein
MLLYWVLPQAKKGRLTMLCRLIFIFSILVTSSLVHAFTLISPHPHRFAANEVAVTVANNDCQNVGITKDDLLNIAHEAVENFWNRVTTSRIKFVKGSVTAPSAADMSSASNVSDFLVATPLNVIHVACVSNYYDTFSDSTLAVGGIASNDVHYVFVNDQSGSAFANLSRQEMVSTLAHEIGHAIGLGHSSIPESLMYYASKKGRERVEWDDWDGIAYLYPIDSLKESCGTIDLQNNDKNGFLLSGILGFLLVFISLFKRQKPQ